MNDLSERERLISQTGLREYFQDSVNRAVERQRQDMLPETVFYLANLLTDFTRTSKLFDKHAEGNSTPALAMIYAEAVEARTRRERIVCLKRLGDLSLFVSGLFSYSLHRSLVDVDYYVAMGGNAYSYLATNSRNTFNSQAFCEIFNELADKFIAAIDILTEVGEQMNCGNNRDIMRLYEIWQQTGSRLAAERLQREGIVPIAGPGLRH
jgi:hypothetical protein